MLGGNVETPLPPVVPNPAWPVYHADSPPAAPAQAQFPQQSPAGYGPPPSIQPPDASPQAQVPEPEKPERAEAERTRALGGVDVDRLRIPRHRYVLQILDSQGQWRDWGPIPANGINIGRSKNSADFPGLGSMAVRHLRLGYDHHQLLVEDLGSLNGVCVRVTAAVELEDGTRFRVGNHVIEFRRAEPFDQEPPLQSSDEEEFFSRDLEPLAYLDLIRPSGRLGLRFPITRREGTVIGRDGRGTNIVLTDDMWVSAPHAQVRYDEGRFLLEDLKSRNGTFVRIVGMRPLQAGDILLAGRVLFRVVDPNVVG